MILFLYTLHLMLLCLVFQADPSQLEAELDNGLVMGHAYSVTAVRFVSTRIALQELTLIYFFIDKVLNCQEFMQKVD